MAKNISELTDLIFSCYPALRNFFRNLVSIKNLPISMTQLTCLNILKNNQCTMSDLAEKLNMSNQQLTKVVDNLVEFELCERIVDKNNRRITFAKITEKGTKMLQSLYREMQRKLTVIVGTNPEDLAKLFDSFNTIAEFIDYKQ